MSDDWNKLKHLVDLSAENARLKAEVERLRLQVGTDAIDREHGMCCDSSAENARLKAEVERLHKYVETMERESMSDEYDINHQTRIINGLLTDKERLQAEVERLRKAGDAMVPLLGRGDYHDARINWNAAKEGKQS